MHEDMKEKIEDLKKNKNIVECKEKKDPGIKEDGQDRDKEKHLDIDEGEKGIVVGVEVEVAV